MWNRLTLLGLATLCLLMNALVWRGEYGSKDQGVRVPASLVWRKILTDPEASSLSVFQHGKRTGFCEFSTGIGLEMAQMDEGKPAPEGLLDHADCLIRINGTTSVGDFTNRVKFDSHLRFGPDRDWLSLDLRVLARGFVLELQTAASNQTLQVTLSNDGETFHRTLTYAELRDPAQLLRSLAGDYAGTPAGLLAGLELPALFSAGSPDHGGIHWEAWRTRMIINHEPVSVYRLETRILDHPVVLITSTLGEILRLELPGEVVATLDEWGKS
jgi:hypothetical protein